VTGDARERGLALVEFADGIEAAGQVATARRCRAVAADLLEALDELCAARDALAAMTADRDRWRENRWREAHGEAWPA